MAEARGTETSLFAAEPAEVVFMRLSLEGKVLSISPTVTRLTGHTVTEHLGLGPLSCVHHDDLASCQKFIATALEADSPLRFAFRLMHVSGSYHWVEATCEALRRSDGEAAELLVLLREVSPPEFVDLDLLESEQLSRQIVNSAMEAIGVMDLELRYIAWNPLMEIISGVKEEEILGKKPLEVFPFLEEMGIYDLILRARNGEVVDSPDIEYAPPNADRAYWSSGRLGPLRNADGQIVGVIVTFHEISDRKRAELELSASEERLRTSEERNRALVEAIPDAMFIQDRNFVYLDYHAQDPDSLRLPPEEFMGKDMREVLPREYCDAAVPLIERVLSTGVGQTLEYTRWISDRRHHFEARLVRCGVDHVLTIVRDITDRKDAEEALRKSQASLAASQEIAHVGSWEVNLDAEGNLVREQGSWSDELFRIHGLSRMPVGEVQSHWSSIASPGEAERIDVGITELIRTGEPFSTDYKIRRPNGEERTLHLLARREDRDGGTRLLGTVQDVTELRNSEQALRELNEELEQRVRERTASLEAVNRELEAFSFSVSHDLRTPLRTIDGYSRMLEEDYGDLLSGEALEYLVQIRQGAQHMGKLIDDILLFSRLNRRVSVSGPVDLNRAAQEALKQIASLRREREVAISIAPLPSGRGDYALLRQAFVNLLSNACKFTRNTPAPKVEVGTEITKHGLAVFIRDNGAGFDPRHADKLFGVFQRLHHPREFEGTGVGLAFVHRIVSRHGGQIWGDGAVNQGATFWMVLPGFEFNDSTVDAVPQVS
ncbi:MAG: PAS domain S-box protein [Fimbriimonadaceae bacterium]|nr:PAS domain S-box protein [Fimbriimonadaceae bacterium]